MQFFFQKNEKNDCALFREIERACEGLVYISETDAPVLAFSGGRADANTGEIILQQIGSNDDEPIEEVSFEVFFARLTAIKDWHGVREKVRAEKFLALQKLLEENLRDLKVFRIGKIRIRILAVGIDKDGCVTGVTAEAVET